MTAEQPAFNEVIHAPQQLPHLRHAERCTQSRVPRTTRPARTVHIPPSASTWRFSSMPATSDKNAPYGNCRNRLWLSLTPEGVSAYSAHVQALRQLLANHDA